MILRVFLFFLLIVILSTVTGLPREIAGQREKKHDWRNDVIYFVLIDRFCDGDNRNNMDVDKNDVSRFQGGDLAGLTARLDYLKELGITALWVSPVFKNQRKFQECWGYHGYWPIDLYHVDDHFGDMSLFENLVSGAHQRGIKVILDITLNHLAWEHPFVSDPTRYEWFHHSGDITDWADAYQMEYYTMYGLPDLAQENPEVYHYLLEASFFWIGTGIDGFRLDAAKHIPHWFWQRYVKEVEARYPGFFMIGEVFDRNPAVIARFMDDGLSSLFDIPLYYAIRSAFCKSGSMKVLAETLHVLDGIYKHPDMMAGFIDNHDTDRFLTSAGSHGREKMKLALAFLFTINRIPVIYYGTEAAMEGYREDSRRYPPENRALMKFGNDPGMAEYVRRLIEIRKSSPSLTNGAIISVWKDDLVYAYKRKHSANEAIIVLNNSGSFQYREIPLGESLDVGKGSVLCDQISGRKIMVRGSVLRINLAPYEAVIFYSHLTPVFPGEASVQ